MIKQIYKFILKQKVLFIKKIVVYLQLTKTNEMKTHFKIYVDSPEILFFNVSKNGMILSAGNEEYPETWKATYIDLSTVKENKPLSLSYNKRQNKKIGLDPVYVYLAYNTTKVEKMKIKKNKTK